MRLASLLHSPAPVHAFAIREDHLLYARHTRRRDALERVEHQGIASSTFQLGPVGLLHVEREGLANALAALLARLDKRPERASLVVPDAWVRTLSVSLEALPRRRDEAEEVVRWRLKKLLPCRPEDLRLDFLPTGGNGRVLVVLMLDKPVATVEDVFGTAGVLLGRIEPAALALTALLPPASEPQLLTVLDERAMALVLISAGKTLLLRHKALPAEPGRAETFVFRELARTLAHARRQEGLGEALQLWLAPPRHALAEAVQRWAGNEAGITMGALAVGDGRVPRGAAFNEVELWSLLATAWQGER